MREDLARHFTEDRPVESSFGVLRSVDERGRVLVFKPLDSLTGDFRVLVLIVQAEV